MVKTEVVSVSLYTNGPRCRGDCSFCSWNRKFAPQMQEVRGFSSEAVAERIAYARRTGAIIEAMDSSVATSRATIERLQLLAPLLSGVAWGINPGITVSAAWMQEMQRIGAGYYANNLETSPRLFPQLVSTHTQQRKIDSLRLARELGLPIYTGFLLGVPGETQEDYVEMLRLIAELRPDVVRLNFFFPVAGLELLGQFNGPDAEKMIRLIAIFRIAFPHTPLYLGAGRSYWLGSRQAEAEALSDGLYCEKRFLNHGAVEVAQPRVGAM
jgi:biotin synthase